MQGFTQQYLIELPQLYKENYQKHKKYFEKLKKSKNKQIDSLFHRLHQQAFELFSCLECGNCCRSLGPRLLPTDIDRLAKNQRQKPADIIAQYVRTDEDNDFVFRTMPCPFLAPDNYCLAYEARPKACREYPHTNRNRMQQILKPTLLNTQTCPAVHWIVERFIEEFPNP